MAELPAVPQETKERMERIGAADVVIGLPGVDRATALRAAISVVRSALAPFSAEGVQAVIAHRDAAAFGDDSQPGEPALEDAHLRLLPFPLLASDGYPAPWRGASDAYLAILAAGRKLGARAVAVLSGAELESETWLQRLVEPVLKRDFDLVTPRYAHEKFEGLINSGIVYPLTRALYGKRIHGQIGADFGFSARMAERCLAVEPAAMAPLAGLPTWMVTEAACGGFQVAEAYLGRRRPASKEQSDASTALAQTLGPIFTGMERTAPFWQKMRGSQPVPSFGTAEPAGDSAPEAHVRPMVESFQLGFRNLQEVWGVILPPATLLELKKLTKAAVDQFRLADELWVRIVYDFALGHRLRVINRDHLLRAMTPLYLAWVASYALEVQAATTAEAEQRIERLGAAYETQKPYLQSRWRWPDRFNP
jgi:glucosylglycerate synthase